jgi:hypothetical protein
MPGDPGGNPYELERLDFLYYRRFFSSLLLVDSLKIE